MLLLKNLRGFKEMRNWPGYRYGIVAFFGTLVLLAMVALGPRVPRTEKFLPHGYCYLWEPNLVRLNVISDTLIGLAYVSIPLTLVYFIRRRSDLPFNWMFVLFGIFIVACGATHWMEVWTLWNPDYWVLGGVKAITAAASVPTAILLYKLVPRALAIPSTAELERARAALEAEVRERRRIEEELRQAHAHLEQRVRERTLELEQARREIAESEERYRLATQAAEVGTWDWDLTSKAVRWNEENKRLHGLRVDADPSYDDWRRVVHPADIQGAERAVQEAATQGGEFRIEYRVNHPISGERWLLGIGRAYRDPSGMPIRMAGVNVDITERKKAEEEVRHLTTTLEQRVAERTKELADTNLEMQAFTYTVSHDLRAPLRGIQGFAHALIEDFSASLGEEGREYCMRIANAGERMEELIEDLLAYSRLAREQIILRPVALELVVAESLKQLEQDLASARAEIDIKRPLGMVLAHRAVLMQAVQNLIGNAIKFVRPGTTPAVRIWSEERAGHVRLNIEDNGIGIEAKNLERIFKVFERLHGVEAYGGTGIGLAIVKRAIERLGGSYGVESVPGKGSLFWLELRKAQEENL